MIDGGRRVTLVQEQLRALHTAALLVTHYPSLSPTTGIPAPEPEPEPVVASEVAEPSSLGTDDLLDSIQARNRAVSIAQSHLLRAVHELALRRAGTAVSDVNGRKLRGHPAMSVAVRAVADELSCELTLSQSDAQKLTDTAVGLSMEATQTLDALARGDIDLPKAKAIVGLTQTILHQTGKDDLNGRAPADVARDLEEKVLKRAPAQKLENLRKSGNRALNNIDPKAAERRHHQAKNERGVRIHPLSDSMCGVTALLPADKGALIMAVLNALAKAAQTSDPHDTRTLDQTRADVLVDLILNPLTQYTTTAPHSPCDHQRDAPQTHTTTTDGRGHNHDDSRNDGDGDGRGGGVHSRGDGDLCDDSTTMPDAEVSDLSGVTVPEAHKSDRTDGDRTGDDDVTTPPAADDSHSTGDDDPANRTPPSRPGSVPPDHLDGDPDHCRCCGHRRVPGHHRLTPKQVANAQIIILISAEKLVGLNDNAAELLGFGPILAPMARELATTGTWRCAITDGKHGTLNGTGKSTYTTAYAPSDPLRRFLGLRDQHCRFPACTRPAENTDIDHTQRYPDGVTCECNTELLCRHHHRVKHETGFTVRFGTDPEEPPGTLVWTTPGGREYRDYPDPIDPTMPKYQPPPATATTATAATDPPAAPPSADTKPPPDHGPPPF